MSNTPRTVLILLAGAAVIFAAVFLLSNYVGGRNQPTQTPLVVTATAAQTAIVVTSTPNVQVPTVTPLPPVQVTVTPPPPTQVVTTVPTACQGAPTIQFFGADPATITQGQSTTLSWGQVINASGVAIDQGIGGVPAPGQLRVAPGQTTTYTMLATGCGGQAQKSVTVTVNVPPTNAPRATATEKPTEVPPQPSPTSAPCTTLIQNVKAKAPSNPGTTLNVSADECYGGEKGDGVVVIAKALDDQQMPISGVTTPSANAGVNKQKSVNLSITQLLGASATKSTQVEVCFQTSQGEEFGCVIEPFEMNWQ